jgi:hypothetical protein
MARLESFQGLMVSMGSITIPSLRVEGIRLVFGADYWGGSEFTELSPSKTSKYRGTIRFAGQI